MVLKFGEDWPGPEGLVCSRYLGIPASFTAHVLGLVAPLMSLFPTDSNGRFTWLPTFLPLSPVIAPWTPQIYLSGS